jgi:H+/Cl- antiporter ClcA
MLHDISHDAAAGRDPAAAATREQLAGERAIKQIERRRRFWLSAAVSTVGMIILAVIWATTEYHSAGGWPTGGFSQSSGIPNVWNYWIIYPFGAWVLLTAAGGLSVYRRKPITESQIKREIERQAGPRR